MFDIVSFGLKSMIKTLVQILCIILIVTIFIGEILGLFFHVRTDYVIYMLVTANFFFMMQDVLRRN